MTTKKKKGIVLIANGAIMFLVVLIKVWKDMELGRFEYYEMMEVFFYGLVSFSQLLAGTTLYRGMNLEVHFNYVINVLVGLSFFMIWDFSGLDLLSLTMVILGALVYLYYAYEFGNKK